MRVGEAMRGEGNSSSVNTGGRMRLGDGAGGGLGGVGGDVSAIVGDALADAFDRTSQTPLERAAATVALHCASGKYVMMFDRPLLAQHQWSIFRQFWTTGLLCRHHCCLWR